MTVNQTTNTPRRNLQNKAILSPFPKPVFIPNYNAVNTKNNGSLYQQSAPAGLRAKSTSPNSFYNITPIPVESEITSNKKLKNKITNLHTNSAPKKLFTNSQRKHQHYADGHYANAPHPSELAHPSFN